MPYVARGGAKIHYTDTGGDGPAVLLGHSFFMDHESFAPQRAALGPHYRLICIDSRGHGLSEDDGTPFSYWDLARDAWAVADHLGIERAVVGGVGHGAFTAVRMALLARPRSRGVIAIGSTADAMPARRKPGYREVLDAWAGTAPLTPIIKMVSALTIGGTDDDKQPWRDKWLAGDRTRLRLSTDCLINRDSVLPLLGEIDCPALVLRGVGDQTADPDEVSRMARAFGVPTTVHTIAGAAMSPNLTHPDAVNALLRGFLDGLPD
ncbi:alpha/beta fold hydrolase [Nocardia sp. SYP-A9097]|uniref:alpha/beta fold hydrolase n=1 Tax=Nocardia sp. SYP-A9097 TaxID=2663237 RepID=UPI00129B1309|nr:alpha/beta hydrolase [Nocardia sp. SYP-A9097]MRH89161.1 alpha/beta fold hydrolase [Nocardia sp. SYP-A9097]